MSDEYHSDETDLPMETGPAYEPEFVEGIDAPEEPVARRRRREAPSKSRSRGRRVPDALAPASRPPKRRRGCLAALLVLVAFVAIIAGGVWWALFKPVVSRPAGRAVQFEVKAGDSTVGIGEKLAAKGIIANPLMFRVVLRTSDATAPLRAGVYDMETGMPYETVLALLREGPPIRYYTLPVPEGWTIDQIAERVQKVSGIQAKEFSHLAKTGAQEFDQPFLDGTKTASLEGYLFPKTYRVKEGSTASDVIGMMLDQFGEETSGLDLSYAAQRGMTLHDVVIIASMVEREARTSRDRPLVASVIYNRLGRHMRLEIDATVQYVIGNKPRLLYSDLRVESPYNTYLHTGLPVGPIANPGYASLEAAASPAKTGYFFYVLTHKDGSHSFAANATEFMRLKAQARQGLK